MDADKIDDAEWAAYLDRRQAMLKTWREGASRAPDTFAREHADTLTQILRDSVRWQLAWRVARPGTDPDALVGARPLGGATWRLVQPAGEPEGVALYANENGDVYGVTAQPLLAVCVLQGGGSGSLG
jgi:hypothetical protein